MLRRTTVGSLRETARSVLTTAVHRLARLGNRIRYGGCAPDPYELIRIDPTEVDRLIVPRYVEPFERRAYVRGGAWDRTYSDAEVQYKGTAEGFDDPAAPRLISFANFTFYTSLETHFVEGRPWEATGIHDVLVEADRYERYESTADVETRFAKLDALYDHMREHGYLSQQELRSRDAAPFSPSARSPPAVDEVLVNIGRDGEIIFTTGRHRFCVARILGLPSIPVRVHVRHRRWQSRRRDLYAGSESTEHVDGQFLTHPDVKALVDRDV